MADKFSHHPAAITLDALQLAIRQTERLEFELVLLGFSDDSGQPLNVSAYLSVDAAPPELRLSADRTIADDRAKQTALLTTLTARGADIVASAVLRIEGEPCFVAAYRNVLAAEPMVPIAAAGPALGDTEYDRLFATCRIAPERLPSVEKIAERIAAERSRYENVSAVSGVPWHVVGLIHSLEADLDFNTHLHNGDPLRRRTVQVPRNRPPQGQPPFEWEDSALDALEHDGARTHRDWSIGGILGFLERFNGTGYRKRGIHSPYLWSFSNHYTAGKFVADGVFSRTAVSKQCGAAVLLKRLIETGAIQTPTQSSRTGMGSDRAPRERLLLGRPMRGSQVAEVQKLLRRGGFLKDIVDGDFGPLTEAAVRTFQRAAGFDGTGSVDEQTLEKLREGALAAVELVPSVRGGTLAEQIASLAEQEAAKNLAWDGPGSEAERLYLAPMRPAMRQLGHVGHAVGFFNWCACWVTYVLRQVGVTVPDQPDGFFATIALVDAVEFWAKKNGTYFAKGERRAQRGDVVFFQFDPDEAEDHIGIVREFSGGSIMLTAEGNRGNRSGNFERRLAAASGFMRVAENRI